jgi:carbon storage regulator
MLVLTRRHGEAVCLSDGVRIVVVQIRGSQVRIGIEAPSDIDICREEVIERDARFAEDGRRAPVA